MPFKPLVPPSVSVLLVTKHCLVNSAIAAFFGNKPFVLHLPKWRRDVPNIRKPAYVVRSNNYLGQLFPQGWYMEKTSRQICLFVDTARAEAFGKFARTVVPEGRAGIFSSVGVMMRHLAPLYVEFFVDQSSQNDKREVNIRTYQPSFQALFAREV